MMMLFVFYEYCITIHVKVSILQNHQPDIETTGIMTLNDNGSFTEGCMQALTSGQ